MSKIQFRAAIAALALTCSTLALAQDDVDHPFSFGAKVGFASLDSGRPTDDGDLLYGFSFGWFLHPKFSLDIEWDKLNTDADLSAVQAFIPGATFDEWNFQTWSLMARYYFKDQDQAWRPYVAFGPGWTRHRSIFDEGWESSLNLGAGLRGQLSERWSTRLEALYRRDGDDTSVPREDGFDDFLFTAGLQFNFGGKEAPPPAPAPAPVMDSDGDGVPDDRDRCPNTPAGVAVDENGCPLDSDGDGVPDYRDKCPDTPAGAIVDRDGCEIPPVLELNDVHFDFDKSNLKPEAIAILDEAAELLTVHETVVIEVAGHTDAIGTDEYNQGLSERRAKSVYDYLVSQGINASRMSTKGYGESRPIATNETSEGRALNRRTELVVIER